MNTGEWEEESECKTLPLMMQTGCASEPVVRRSCGNCDRVEWRTTGLDTPGALSCPRNCMFSNIYKITSHAIFSYCLPRLS